MHTPVGHIYLTLLFMGVGSMTHVEVRRKLDGGGFLLLHVGPGDLTHSVRVDRSASSTLSHLQPAQIFEWAHTKHTALQLSLLCDNRALEILKLICSTAAQQFSLSTPGQWSPC